MNGKEFFRGAFIVKSAPPSLVPRKESNVGSVTTAWLVLLRHASPPCSPQEPPATDVKQVDNTAAAVSTDPYCIVFC